MGMGRGWGEAGAELSIQVRLTDDNRFSCHPSCHLFIEAHGFETPPIVGRRDVAQQGNHLRDGITPTAVRLSRPCKVRVFHRPFYSSVSVCPLAWGLCRIFLLYARLLSLVGGGGSTAVSPS